MGAPPLHSVCSYGKRGYSHYGLIWDSLNYALLKSSLTKDLMVFRLGLGRNGREWLRVGVVNKCNGVTYRVP